MKYQNKHLEFIKAHCKLPRQELAEEFNTCFGTTVSQIAIAGICKRYGWLRDREDWSFKKGSIPVNKGTKGLTSANKTSFKKGMKPHNYRPIGSERLTTKDRYIEVKIAEPNKWKLKHRLVWENTHGKIPRGFCISFLDSNRQNCELSNLRLISMAENAVFNKAGYAQYPSEFIPTLRNMAKLKTAIGQKKRQHEKRGN